MPRTPGVLQPPPVAFTRKASQCLRRNIHSTAEVTSKVSTPEVWPVAARAVAKGVEPWEVPWASIQSPPGFVQGRREAAQRSSEVDPQIPAPWEVIPSKVATLPGTVTGCPRLFV